VRENIYTEGLLDTVRHWDGSLLSPSSPNRRVEGVRVFKAHWFEAYFATAHPIMPGVWWLPVISACAFLTFADSEHSVLAAIANYLGGLLLWTLLEYLLHRFLFHKLPDDDFDSKLRQFLMHGYHHEFPNDRRRLVAPLLLSLPIALVVAASYYALFGPQAWLMWFAGTVSGYLAYDWIHYYTHHFRPTTRLGKFLRRYHLEHHYKHSDAHFGISSPLWDWVFGTAKPKVSRQSECV
jgi:sterol desaturase/sphingolipid hydroxylase (fatty acid hydroxylase superfamily)